MRRTRTPGGVSEEIRKRHSWLELLQISGPFLTLPVVHRVFPNGLAEVRASERAKIRGLVAQMMDDRRREQAHGHRDSAARCLRLAAASVIGDAVPETLTEFVADHGVRLRPDFGYFDEDDEDSADDECDEDESRTKTTTRPMER